MIQKKKRSTKRKKRTVRSKIKRFLVVSMLVFIMGGIYFNSRQFNGYKAEVYAELKEKTGIASYVTSEGTEEEAISSSISTADENVVKNLTLTIDMDLRTPSNASAEEIDSMLRGTALEGLGSAFVKAEQKYNINALYMVGLACLESGYGTSYFAKDRNNLYGWNAVDSNPGQASSFNTMEESTLYVARKLQANYLTEGGAYFEGYTARDIDVHYCTDKEHADKIVNIVSNLLKKLG